MTPIELEAIVNALHDLDTVEDGEFVAVRAAEHLHHSATLDDVPCLVRLLQDESFFVREAAAWPLSELAGATHVRELLEAYQRGFDEGHDNDGFSAALADMTFADPVAISQALEPILSSADASMQSNTNWLLQFCREETN